MPDIIEIHTTDKANFKKCRQYWEFNSNIRFNMEPARPDSALWLGTGFHESLGVYYTPETPRNSDEAIAHYENYVKSWLKQSEDESEETFDWAMNLLDLGVGMLDTYFTFAKKNDKFDVLWTEREFYVQLFGPDGEPLTRDDGTPILYSFRTDALLSIGKRIYIGEWKTIGQWPQNFEWLLIDSQAGSYLWCLEQILEDLRIEGVLYRFVKKKAPSPLKLNKPTAKEPIIFSIDKNQDTTPEIVHATLTDAFGPLKKWAPKYQEFYKVIKERENNFVREEYVRRNRKELQGVGESIRMETLDMVNEPSIYRTDSQFNCNRCPFMGPCIAKWEGSDWESMLFDSGLYQEKQKPYTTREYQPWSGS